MKYSYLLFVLSLILLACNTNTIEHSNQSKVKSAQVSASQVSIFEENENDFMEKDTTPRVTGIGGIFFGTQDVKATNDWYAENLGMAMDAYGAVFEFRNGNAPDEINYCRWSSINQETEMFDPSKKEFMINYRVQNIEGMVRKLKANGATILDEIVAYDYGKFVHVLDNDGNKIELWETIDSFLTQMGGVTNK